MNEDEKKIDTRFKECQSAINLAQKAQNHLASWKEWQEQYEAVSATSEQLQVFLHDQMHNSLVEERQHIRNALLAHLNKKQEGLETEQNVPQQQTLRSTMQINQQAIEELTATHPELFSATDETLRQLIQSLLKPFSSPTHTEYISNQMQDDAEDN